MNIKDIDSDLVKSIAKLYRFLQAEKIGFDEFASNVIIRLVDYDYNNVEECLKQLDDDHLVRLSDYAKDYFRANDFRPHPGVFMVDTSDVQEVEAKREELKPKYEALMSHIEKAEKVLKKADG